MDVRRKLWAIHGSPGIVYTPLDVTRHHSSTTMTTRFIFRLYAIRWLEQTTVRLVRCLPYLVDLWLGYKTRVAAAPWSFLVSRWTNPQKDLTLLGRFDGYYRSPSLFQDRSTSFLQFLLALTRLFPFSRTLYAKICPRFSIISGDRLLFTKTPLIPFQPFFVIVLNFSVWNSLYSKIQRTKTTQRRYRGQ